jgi:excisionase family DNA binding protein
VSPVIDQSDYITADEIAARLHVHRSTITRWIDSGWMPPPIRLGSSGRHLRWRRTAIEEFLQKLEAGTAGGPDDEE